MDAYRQWKAYRKHREDAAYLAGKRKPNYLVPAIRYEVEHFKSGNVAIVDYHSKRIVTWYGVDYNK